MRRGWWRSFLDHLARTAHALDPLARSLAECVRVDGQGLAQLALGEDLDRDILASGEPFLAHRLERHSLTGFKARLEVEQVHRLGVRAERLKRHGLLHM